MKIPIHKRAAVCCIVLIAAWICGAAGSGLRGVRRQFGRKNYAAAETELRSEIPRLKGSSLQQANLLLATLQTDVSEARRILFSVVRNAEPREELSARLELAKIAFALGDYGEVVQLLAGVPTVGRGAERQEAIYFRGMARKMRGDIESARGDLRSIDRGGYLFWSSIALAEIDMQSGRFQGAVERFETMAGSYSNPIAGFWLGECYEVMGEREKALSAYRTLASRFPESPEAPKAREKISMIESYAAHRRPAGRAGGGEQRKSPVVERDAVSHDSPFFTLQFGAFSDRDNARALVAQLEEMIDGLHIETIQAGGTVWHRVRSGRFSSRAEAEQAAVRIMERTGYSSRVLPVE